MMLQSVPVSEFLSEFISTIAPFVGAMVAAQFGYDALASCLGWAKDSF